MLIYDIHSHFGPTSSGENSTIEIMLDELNKFGVKKVGISCLSGNCMVEQNNIIHNAMSDKEERILGYCFLNPKEQNALEELDRCLGLYKMKGVKLHSWKQGYYPDNRPELQKIFEKIQEYGVHVQIHVGTAPLSTPYVWAEWAKKFPKIDFIFTHIGYYEFGMSTIEAIKDLKNVWVETSGQMDIDVLKKAIKILGSKRIVFGTDWPYKPINIEIEKFNYLELSEEEKEDIFYKNAMYLWRMDK